MNIIDNKNQSIVYIAPSIVTESEYQEVLNFFEIYHDNNQAPFYDLNYRDIVDKYFNNNKLRLIVEFEFRSLLGFALEKDRTKLDYIFIKNALNKLKILTGLLDFYDYNINEWQVLEDQKQNIVYTK